MVTKTENEYMSACPTSRINWGAIIGGSIIGLFFQVLFSLFGIAVGITALNPGARVGMGFGIGAGIYLVLITIISVFIGAFAAGRFTGLASRYDGLLHGVATLALLTIVSLFTITSGLGATFSYGLQVAKLPQVQQVAPSGSKIQEKTTGAAANITPRQQMYLQQQANKFARRATWTTFITGLLSLIAAAFGGILGLKSRIKQNVSASAY